MMMPLQQHVGWMHHTIKPPLPTLNKRVCQMQKTTTMRRCVCFVALVQCALLSKLGMRHTCQHPVLVAYPSTGKYDELRNLLHTVCCGEVAMLCNVV